GALHELLRTPKMQNLLRAYRRSALETRAPRLHSRRHRTIETVDRLDSRRPRRTTCHATTCERLYEEVWSAPTQQIAQQYSVTDIALAKACKRLQIPKPPTWILGEEGGGVRVPAKPALPALPGLRPKD